MVACKLQVWTLKERGSAVFPFAICTAHEGYLCHFVPSLVSQRQTSCGECQEASLILGEFYTSKFILFYFSSYCTCKNSESSLYYFLSNLLVFTKRTFLIKQKYFNILMSHQEGLSWYNLSGTLVKSLSWVSFSTSRGNSQVVCKRLFWVVSSSLFLVEVHLSI